MPPVYIGVLANDYSRYALAAVAGLATSTEWVAQITQEVIRRCGQPDQLVSDNG
jgi:hypothetical protein